MNYYRSLGEEWWSRWRTTHGLEFHREDLDRLPVDYLILSSPLLIPNSTPEYQNQRFAVYRVR